MASARPPSHHEREGREPPRQHLGGTSMAKKVRAILKVQAPAARATAAPPVGPALGQHGINIMQFIKAFNERTANLVGYLVPAEMSVFEDRSFTLFTNATLTVTLLKIAADA